MSKYWLWFGCEILSPLLLINNHINLLLSNFCQSYKYDLFDYSFLLSFPNGKQERSEGNIVCVVSCVTSASISKHVLIVCLLVCLVEQ